MSKKDGIYCTTAGHVFEDKTAFTEHYKSDFHLYNLNRRVAGLPPVKREWFEDRKRQVLSNIKLEPKRQTWIDPLTKKRFQSESTYQAFVQSKKYQSLLKQEGLSQVPEPLIAEKASKTDSGDQITETESVEIGSTDWDVTVSLFDWHQSSSLESNLEYMFKKFGFYFPKSEFLRDATGLLKYLGAKLCEGRIPLYCSGLNPEAKQFASLKAVQNHMIDTHKCTMLFDGNEEEYIDYYDLKALLKAETGMEVASGSESREMMGYEMVVKDGASGRSKILGNRTFWNFYRQRYRQCDTRDSVLTCQLLAKHRALLCKAKDQTPDDVRRSRRREAGDRSQRRLKTELRSNVNNNLPRNVPY